ncbi:hypothetical protein CFP56_036876, partial [Quercus suber]
KHSCWWGSRKKKRSASSSSNSSSSNTSSKNKLPDLVTPQSLSQSSTQNTKIHEGHDLNLGFPTTQEFRTITELVQVPSINNDNSNKNQISGTSSTTTNTTTASHQLSALELLTGITSRAIAILRQTPQSLSQSSTQNTKIHEGHDLNLGFPTTQEFRTITELVQVPSINNDNSNKNQISGTSSTTTNTTTASHQLSALELLTGITSRGFNSFMIMPV